MANLIFCKLAGILQLHVFLAWRSIVRSQRQAAQGVLARPPFSDLRHELVAHGWCQRHLSVSHPYVLAPLYHALRRTLRGHNAIGKRRTLKKWFK